MKKINLFIVFLIALLPFLPYFFVGSLQGFDSFANFNLVCGKGTYQPASEAWGFVLSFFPCDVFLVKVLQFLSYFLVLLLVARFGEFVFGENGWELGVFVGGLCPLLFQTALQFEATWWGFVVVWMGFVGFVETIEKGIHKNKAYALFFALIMLFGCVLWRGGLLYFGSLSLYWLVLLIISIPIALINLTNLLSYALNGGIFSENPIMEEMPIVGATPTILLWPFVNKTPKKWLLPTIFLFIIGLIKVKYMFLAVPFLALGVFVINQSNKDLKILGKHKWPNLILMSLVCSACFGLMNMTTEPTQQTFELIEQGIYLSEDNNMPLYNDWSYGWWIEHKGGQTIYKSSYPEPDYNSFVPGFYAITQYYIDLPCETINTSKQIKLLKC